MTEKTKINTVFLGGSCNPTTWRADSAIPALEDAGVDFFNPQVDDWFPELADIEAEQKEEAPQKLFVIDGQTRAIASILEATEYISRGHSVHLVIEDIEDGTVIADKTGDQTVTGRELKDLNRARTYLRELAERHDTPIYDSVEEAVEGIIEAVSG